MLPLAGHCSGNGYTGRTLWTGEELWYMRFTNALKLVDRTSWNRVHVVGSQAEEAEK